MHFVTICEWKRNIRNCRNVVRICDYFSLIGSVGNEAPQYGRMVGKNKILFGSTDLDDDVEFG